MKILASIARRSATALVRCDYSPATAPDLRQVLQGSNSAEGSSLNQINTSDLTDATNNATGSEDGATGTVDDIFSQDDLDATGDSDSFSDPSTDFTSDSSTGLFGNDEFDTGGGDISFDFARRLRARALKWW